MVATKKGKGASQKKKRDGFVFNNTKIDNALYDFVYNKIPFGRRREELKRLILLGFIAETGYSLDKNDIIPASSVPKPINVDDVLSKLFNVENRENDFQYNNRSLINEENTDNNSFNDTMKCIRIISTELYDVIDKLNKR